MPGSAAGAVSGGGPAGGAFLRVRDVGWRAGPTVILERVAFEAAPGELIALMGRNGAGKSTLIDLVCGLRQPSEGAIVLDGRALDEWDGAALARVRSHLPQAIRGDLSCTVEQLVAMGRYPHADRWFETDDDRAAAERAMARCGCLDFRRRRVSTLSGGERQRVLLAACLAQEARLLLLDEPATFLDVDQQLHCFSLLRAEADAGAACIAVTHDINLALTFCTRLIVLAERSVALDVPTQQACEEPEWLRLFSSRLAVRRTPGGRPWVWYE